jgi:SAM-dependent methyltransferase
LPQHVDPERKYDTTSLQRGGSQERAVHRDYAAHFFRWGFAGRFVRADATSVLDVGCGVDCAMVGILNHPRNVVPGSYVGVDYNPEPKKVPHRNWAKFHWEFDFVERHAELGQFDLVTCFEVLEHVRKPDGEKFLAGLRQCLRSDGTLLLSTPVFNGKAAANHLYEWRVDELAAAIDAAGLRVERRHGTFASWRDVKKVAAPAELELARRLSEYYSGEVLSCFLAPLYPDASRNCVWVLRRKP